MAGCQRHALLAALPWQQRSQLAMDPTPSQRSLGATSARKVIQVHHGAAIISSGSTSSTLFNSCLTFQLNVSHKSCFQADSLNQRQFSGQGLPLNWNNWMWDIPSSPGRVMEQLGRVWVSTCILKELLRVSHTSDLRNFGYWILRVRNHFAAGDPKWSSWNWQMNAKKFKWEGIKELRNSIMSNEKDIRFTHTTWTSQLVVSNLQKDIKYLGMT